MIFRFRSILAEAAVAIVLVRFVATNSRFITRAVPNPCFTDQVTIARDFTGLGSTMAGTGGITRESCMFVRAIDPRLIEI